MKRIPFGGLKPLITRVTEVIQSVTMKRIPFGGLKHVNILKPPQLPLGG